MSQQPTTDPDVEHLNEMWQYIQKKNEQMTSFQGAMVVKNNSQAPHRVLELKLTL